MSFLSNLTFHCTRVLMNSNMYFTIKANGIMGSYVIVIIVFGEQSLPESVMLCK